MRISPTQVSRLVVYFILATPIGWSVTKSWSIFFGQALQVTLANVGVLFFVAGILLAQALHIRQAVRSHEHRMRLDAAFIAKFVVLAMAISRVSAFIAGLYLGVFIYYLSHNVGVISRNALLPSALAVLGSVLLVVLALWIERFTKLPTED